MLKWPDREQVLSAARRWASDLRRRAPEVLHVHAVGSYARGDWGVGSDLDVIVVLSESDLWPSQRYARYYPQNIPVPSDLWVYTKAEWEALPTRRPHLWSRLRNELRNLAS